MPEIYNGGGSTDPGARALFEMLLTMRANPAEVYAESLESMTNVTPEAAQPENRSPFEACMDDLRGGLAQVISDAYANRLQHYNGETISTILVDMNRMAAADMRTNPDNPKNHETIALNIDLLSSLPSIPESALARACIIGVAARNDHAQTKLDIALWTEKQQHIDGTARRPGHSRLLEGVVLACQENDVPPQEWINKYATGNRQRTELYTHYYERCVNAGGPNSERDQDLLDLTIGDVLNDPDAGYVVAKIANTFELTKNIALRRRLVDTFLHLIGDMEPRLESIAQLTRLGTAVASDPDLATAERISSFKSHIDAFADSLLGPDSLSTESAVLVEQTLHRWNLRLAGTPEEIINLIYAQSRTIIRYQKEAASVDADAIREFLLSEYAEEYAQKQDFNAARMFLGNIMNSARRVFATRECLSAATTPQDVSLLVPDPLELAHNSALALEFDIAAARVAGNTNALANMATHYAQAMTDSNQMHTLVKRLHAAISKQNEEQGAQLAKTLLGIMRGKNEPPEKFFYLSEVLIRKGDPDEPHRAKADIDQSHLQGLYHLKRKWVLASLLAEKFA